jgi:protein gp37
VKKPKLVEIVWRDILGTSGWEKLEEVNPPLFKTYGFLVHKDKRCVKVAHTLDVKDNVWSGITAFPAGCIEKISPLSGAIEVKIKRKRQRKK